ncbi:MAG: aminotransferase class I/II-fold pyridoxal phosphate-dependent enzyme [Polyangiaceae bacterium]|nr:aminotransferase class I/II-fold pyridoxal phosphate-dependent enzyme [Polyangiaceae bacterium]
MTRPRLAARLAGFGTSVFTEITALAAEHGAVNLGQGFPDFDAPALVREAARAGVAAGRNQYVRSAGLPDLTAAIAAHVRRHRGLDFDAEREITVTSGATEAIAAALIALLEPGDEVLAFEPAYDSYPACAAMAGATLRAVPLEPPGWAWSREALERAVGPRTRVLLLNTPHNPTGKVWSRAELAELAELCQRHDLVAVTDEVYEHLVFEGEHVPLASLPGMRDRTVTVSSGGKTFSATGFKVGWALAAAELTRAVRTTHQFLTFCSPGPLQLAIAAGLSAPEDYFHALRVEYVARRDRLLEALAGAGLSPIRPAGTYFVCVDPRPLGFDDDAAFCRALIRDVGVAAIPVSALRLAPAGAPPLARFAFCKRDETLDEAARRLRAGVPRLRPGVG